MQIPALLDIFRLNTANIHYINAILKHFPSFLRIAHIVQFFYLLPQILYFNPYGHLRIPVPYTIK